jgi:hypothetical protein
MTGGCSTSGNLGPPIGDTSGVDIRIANKGASTTKSSRISSFQLRVADAWASYSSASGKK